MSGKCDELKDKWFNAYPEIIGIEGDEPTQCYGKADVDAAIEELKDEIYNQKWRGDEWAKAANDKDKQITELKGELKDIADDRNEFKQLYSEQTEKLCIEITNVDTLEQEFRKTQRALWLARAERAKEMCKRLLIQGFDPKWENVERKCRAKAEEYN